MTADKRTGRARIFDEGVRVYAPQKREDGSWSKRYTIIAIFMESAEAEAYVATKQAAGVPARMEV